MNTKRSWSQYIENGHRHLSRSGAFVFLLFLVIAVSSIVPSVTGEQSTSALKIQPNFKWCCLDSNMWLGLQDD